MFTVLERAIWRNIASGLDTEWVDLPGPAAWWLEDPEYYTAYGWDSSYLDPGLALQALMLITKCDK